MDVKGKTALVTGGAHRIGKAITLKLAQAGANVIINYHTSASEAEDTAAEARQFGVKSVTIGADISDSNQVKTMVDQAKQHFNAIDILVNSSSLFKQTPVPTVDFSTWHQVTGVLINGPFYCTNFIAPIMQEKGEGAIVNIIDLSVWESWPGFAAHTVGKSALFAMTRQMAMDLAPAIRVNAVAPGPVLPPPHYDAERIERTAHKTLLNKWGSPEDVTRTVLFLIESDYITGEVIVVDGGERYGHRKHEEG
jgi:NAD(P)-dependent dehydrogenase (short-subunit alcohol dehydrogenase family)